jgi:hypothetical protein
MGQTDCFPYQLSHCDALSPLVCICCCSFHPNLCHRFGRNHPCQLDLWQKVFISSFLPFLGRMHNYCLLLLTCFPFTVPKPSSCDLCIRTTQTGSVVTKTLLFHTYYSCAGSVIGSCSHNHTLAPMVINISASTPLTTLGSNCQGSGASATLGTSSAAPRCLALINQCQCSLMHVRP